MRKLGEYLSVRPEAQICAGEGADFLVDLSEGGIYAALWRLSVKTRRGLRVDMAAIPLLQETIELANYYDIDPYKMRSAGSLLAVTADADALVEALEGSGIPAGKIGELTEDHDKILINDDEVRYLDLPQTDELHRILDK
jgi:hydrogenase maturation factor